MKCLKEIGFCLECVRGRYVEDCLKMCLNCLKDDC